MEGQSKPFNTNNAFEIQRLELALESAGIGTWELTVKSGQIQWCHRAKKLFQFVGADVTSLHDLLQLVHSEDQESFLAAFTNTATDGSSASFSLEFRTAQDAQGKSRWILCKGQHHNEPDNSSDRILGTFIDVTREVENQQLLKQEQKLARRFQTIVEQAPMAIGLLKGPDLIIEVGNEKIFEVWGKDKSIVGKTLAEALPEIEGQPYQDMLQNVYRTGKPYNGTNALARLVRNGELEDAYFDFVYAPMREDNGEITGIMVLANEVTQQHITLKALADSEAKFKALINQAPTAISLFVGKEMIVELANQPMIGYWGKDESVIGKPLREALPELVGQPFLDILDNIYETGIPYSSQNAAADLEVDGKLSTFYFNFTYKPIFDSKGNIYGIIDMAIDVTAQVLAQKALQESESKLMAVIESAPAAIGLFVGRELIVELPNQSFIDIVGKGPDIAGLPLRDVMPELENQPFLQILDDVYTTGITYQSYGTQVNIVRHGVMTHNFYDITYSPVFDNQGKVYAILDIAIDVTERVAVEKQIHESQLQLLSLFEQSPVGIAMINKDQLTFTMANPFYGQLVGREPKDIIGKPLLEALPEIQGQGFDHLLENVIATGIPFVASEQAVDISYDGILKTIYVDLAYQPQRDLQGGIMGVLVVATELTQQVLSRKRIEETQMFLQGAIELAELGTYSLNLENGLVDYSERMKHWFGLEKESSLTLEQVYAAISETDLPSVIHATEQAIAPGSNGIFDMEYVLDAEKAGVARILHAQGKVLYDESGAPKAVSGTARDVTKEREIKIALEQLVQERTEELEATNEELAAINEEYIATNEELSDLNNMLQQSNVNLQQFAYVASHDLQEPLRKIQSFSDILMNRYGEKLGDGMTYLQRMQGAAKRMSELIEDLLSFSRLASPRDLTSMVSLTKIVNETLNDLEVSISESSADVTFGQLPEIKGDTSQLSQLFLNLLSNAIKFKKPHEAPVITISAQRISASELPASVMITKSAHSYYKIDVADNGIGFAQEYADRVFQLFQRLHGRSQYPGTGIGLAICERVAANHGGGISVESQPGKGSTFSVYFPVE